MTVGQYGPEVVLNGSILSPILMAATAITVRNPDNSAATLYTDTTGATTLGSNIVTTDSRGNLTFFAAAGPYKLVYSDSVGSQSLTVIVYEDAADLSAAFVPWSGGTSRIVKAGTAQLDNDPSVPGGFGIGGQGPGTDYTLLGSSGNPGWTQMQPTRVGSAYQHQLYPGGYAGVGTANSGTDVVNISYSSLYGDLTDLYIGLPVGFNGRMYKLKAVPSSTTSFSLINMDGTAVSFASTVTGVFKIAYVVAVGTCSTSGTALTRTAGDYLFTGNHYANKVLISGTWYDVSSWTDISHATLGASAGTQTGVAFKQVAVDAGAYFTLLRLQGIRGVSEDDAAFTVNLPGQVRIDTNYTGSGVPAPDLVLGTGTEAELPSSVDYNSRKAHLRITGTGEVIAGAGLADPFSKADLGSAIYDLTADKPKLGAYRYSQTAMTGGGTTRMTLMRFGANYVGNLRSLDVAIQNNFFGPFLQGRQGASTPVDVAVQPEGGNFVVGGGVATTATSGWLWVSSCAGAPTGAPAATGWANTIPVVYDRTNNKLYAYNSGWKGVTLA